MKEANNLSVYNKRLILPVLRKGVCRKSQRMSVGAGTSRRTQEAEGPREEIIDWYNSNSSDVPAIPVSSQPAINPKNDSAPIKNRLKEVGFVHVRFLKRPV